MDGDVLMGFDEWAMYGYQQGFCTPPVCINHDYLPTTATEDEADDDQAIRSPLPYHHKISEDTFCGAWDSFEFLNISKAGKARVCRFLSPLRWGRDVKFLSLGRLNRTRGAGDGRVCGSV